MFLDASSIIAIIALESDAVSVAARLSQADRVITSPIAVSESMLGLARIGNMAITDAAAVVDRFIEEVGAAIVSINSPCGRDAIAAFKQYGKGCHPAALNLGGCFAYACGRKLGVPMLCKGSDFPLTDIAIT